MRKYCDCPGLHSYIEMEDNKCVACKRPIKLMNPLTAKEFFPYFGKEIEFEDNRSYTMPWKGKGTVVGIREHDVEIRVNNNITLWYPLSSLNIIFHLYETPQENNPTSLD
jgi:hypothetical protein